MSSDLSSTPIARVGSVPAEPDVEWAARIVQEQGEVVLRLLWRILGREADVMDAYQDTFCRLASLPVRPDLRSARAYIIRTASNIAVEMIRSRNRRRAHWPDVAAMRSSDSAPTPDDADAAADELRRRIADLPPHLRNVVTLRDLCRLSYDEVGRMLSIDPATARVYRRHAVVRLAALMDGGAAGESPGATSGGMVKDDESEQRKSC